MSKVLFALCSGAAWFVLTGAAGATECSNPQLTRAITEVTGRAPNGGHSTGDCNIAQYGSWSTYDQLKAAVRSRLGGGAAPSLAYQPGGAPSGAAMRQLTISAAQARSLPTKVIGGRTAYYMNGQWYSLIASGGGNLTLGLIASGGGNVVGTNGGN